MRGFLAAAAARVEAGAPRQGACLVFIVYTQNCLGLIDSNTRVNTERLPYAAAVCLKTCLAISISFLFPWLQPHSYTTYSGRVLSACLILISLK